MRNFFNVLFFIINLVIAGLIFFSKLNFGLSIPLQILDIPLQTMKYILAGCLVFSGINHLSNCK